jgi:AcrR family transcriptional regulator
MPRLWTHTIETHRRDVRDAILDTTASLVTEHGLLSVTMSRIAEETGIGRATLYKYFPSVEAILVAWHEAQIARHLHELKEAGSQAGGGHAIDRLEAVIGTFALSMREYHGSELAALLHQGDHFEQAWQQLKAFISGLVAEAAAAGEVRDDIEPGELANYCMHALEGAGDLPSKAAVRRLVAVILDGIRQRPSTTKS